ncbi:MAG: ribosome small subunit-dependent GTPase A [Leptonema sp. (in: Bacteria)]|nr:ribosome small subunit-dependent GTPase A [Leptonema sp. (in: bacteria)]
MKWIVKEIHGAFYTLLSEDLSQEQLAVLRGKHRIDRETHPSGIRFRNPISVGDRVMTNNVGSPLAIDSVEQRKNYLFRSSPSEIHLLGANIDQALLVVSVKTPPLRPGFIDRFLLSANFESIPVWIFFTKSDLLDLNSDEDQKTISLIEIYRQLGITCFYDSLTETKNRKNRNQLPGLADLIQSLSGTTLVVGPSGVGKSTLINHILPNFAQKTSSISQSSGKGRHTTTSSQMFRLASTGTDFLIDTPGIKEWGVAHLTKKQILETTIELSAGFEHCQFRNCEHEVGTEGCGIQQLLNANVLSPSRQKSLDLILEERHQRIRPGDYKKPTGRLRSKDE